MLMTILDYCNLSIPLLYIQLFYNLNETVVRSMCEMQSFGSMVCNNAFCVKLSKNTTETYEAHQIDY